MEIFEWETLLAADKGWQRNTNKPSGRFGYGDIWVGNPVSSRQRV